MSEHTNIAWATSTFNPWIGCTKVSPGCDGCYAEALMDARYHKVKWGAGQPRQRTSEAYWRRPLAWNEKARESGKPWRVFCGSLCDVFDNDVPADWRADLFELIEHMPSLTWMLLTKRIGHALTMISDSLDDVMRSPRGWPWPNVWIGATVVNQKEADRDVPKLLDVPAAVRFLSIEPMIEAIDLTRFLKPWCDEGSRPGPHPGSGVTCSRCGGTSHTGCPGVQWVIVGGESDQPGHRARPFVHRWGKDVVAQCRAAGVPVFVKQMGSNAVNMEGLRHPYEDRAGADPSEWPADLRVREFPR